MRGVRGKENKAILFLKRIGLLSRILRNVPITTIVNNISSCGALEYPHEFIGSAFSWSKTKEGYVYWHEVYRNLESYAHNMISFKHLKDNLVWT